MERLIVHLRFRNGERRRDALGDWVCFVDDTNLAWLDRRAAARKYTIWALHQQLDLAVVVSTELVQLTWSGVRLGHVPSEITLVTHIHLGAQILRQLLKRILRSHLLHRHHERHRPVRRVQHHEAQLAGLHSVDNLLRLGLTNVAMPHMPPVDQHVQLSERLGG